VTIAVVGDLLGYRKPLLKLANPAFDNVVKIIAGSDAGFLNLEGAIFDLKSFEGSHAAENGGGYPLDEPEVASELATIGIKLISLANNHGTDWGTEGMLASGKVLDDAGLVHAGSGISLSAARAPAYLKLPKATIALVASASTYTPMSVAGAGSEHLRPRPGISALRNQPIYLVTRTEMDALRSIASRRDTIVTQGGSNQVSLSDTAAFRVSDSPGMTYDVNQVDRKEIVDAVREGKKNSNLVVFSIHAHETAAGDGEDQRPADFLTPLFHDLVDAGADVIVRHGPHALNGIEVYHGRPIFYGMGSFFFSVGGPSRRLTIDGNGTDAQHVELKFPDSWYDSAIASTEFRRGLVKRIRIYPLTMQMEPGPMFGAPQIATEKDAKRILEKLQHDSATFGTQIHIEGDIGVIRGPG
jgi:poly-gamma-glutamate synthesis protein (capsule biosynthesis protein)